MSDRTDAETAVSIQAARSPARPGTPIAKVQQWGVRRATQLGRAQPVMVATPVGTLDAGPLADVDPSGLVHMRGCSWSVDWWIGAEDRWHFPASDTAVTQTLSGSSPVLRTVMRVPGGDIIQRVYGVRASSVDEERRWDDSAVVVEVENQSAVPVALAFVIRPVTLWGDGSIDSLEANGPRVSVDGRVAAVLSRPIARRVVGPPETIPIRLDLGDDEQPDGSWAVADELAEGAFVVPLPHKAVVRLLLPPPVESPASGIGRRRVSATSPGSEWTAPSAEQIEKGWQTYGRGSVNSLTPETLLNELLTVSGRLLVLAATDDVFEARQSTSAALRSATLCEALVTAGIDEPLEPIARALVDSQTITGAIRMADRSDAQVALMHCASTLLVGAQSEQWTERLLGPVAKAIHRLDRGRGIGPREAEQDSPEAWRLRRSAALAVSRLGPALESIGQPEVAAATHELFHRLSSQTAAMATAMASASTEAASTETASTERPVSALGTFFRAIDVDHRIATRDPGAFEMLMEIASIGHLGGLADRLDHTGTSDGQIAFDPAAVAARLATLLDFLVDPTASSVDILPVWPELWFGKRVEVNNVATRWGRVSYALRWHGERPAVLWEIEPRAGIDPAHSQPIVRVPGLDGNWHAHGWSGEDLLGPVVVSDRVHQEIAERDKPSVSVALGSRPRTK